MKYPESFQELIDCFSMYPGIGPKTAERLAFHTILKLKKEKVSKFSESLVKAYESIKKCSVCGALTDKEVCDICSDENRSKTIMVVESSKEVNVFEKTNQYNGKYHVLNGLVSPLNGVGPDDINLASLFKRIDNEKIEDVIISTSASINGEMTSMYIKNYLEEKNKNINVYRIGYGLPAGADIEYADEVTLVKALEGKRKF